MRYGYTIVYVANVVTTFDFYERAFGLARCSLHESGQYGELETGTTTLGLFPARSGGRSLPGQLRPLWPDGPLAGVELRLVTEGIAGA